jgi:MerR family transcriptional regulator/heat shock protein HspR
MKEPGNAKEESTQELQPVEHSMRAVYTIEAIADLAQVPRRLIVLYCKHGLVVPASKSPDSGWYFDDRAIHAVRRIENLRSAYGMNLTGIKLMMHLMKEVERLREEVRFFHRQ